ncbi:MAG: hypothetical protein HYU86_04605 [Chloroflexi bacterium]|nr:hypothetical protein [Chloroflexota bacterium]
MVEWATLGVLVITFGAIAWYSWETRQLRIETGRMAEATRQQAEASVKMAEEMRAQRLDAICPIIAIEGEFYLQIVGEHTIQLHEVKIRNVGNGPALNVRCTLEYPDHDFEPREFPVLAVGDPKQFAFATGFGRIRSRLHSCPASIIVYYTDLFRNNKFSRVSFVADEVKQSVFKKEPLRIDEGSEDNRLV